MSSDAIFIQAENKWKYVDGLKYVKTCLEFQHFYLNSQEEWPNILAIIFKREFYQIPQECM